MLNLLLQHSNELSLKIHEVHMVREPHGSLEQVHWSARKAALKWSPFSKIGFTHLRSTYLLITFYRSSNFVADFKLPGDCFVCVITEADYIGDCKSFRLSLGWLICKFLVNFQITVLPRSIEFQKFLAYVSVQKKMLAIHD